MSNIDMVLSRIISEKSLEPHIREPYVHTFLKGYEMKESHSHKEVEVISVLHGTSHLIIDNQCIKISKGECIVIFPAVSHRFFMGDSRGCRIINVHFQTGDLSGLFSDTELQKSLQFLYELSTHARTYIRFTDTGIIADLSERIIKEYEKTDTYSQSILKLYFCNLYIHLSKVLSDNCNVFFKPFNKYIANALEYINDRYNTELSVEQIAGHVGLSSRHFSRIFSEYLKVSVQDYITLIRLKKAKELLENTDLSVTYIAQQVGFNTSQYFATTFKKYESMTPCEYRRIVLDRVYNRFQS